MSTLWLSIAFVGSIAFFIWCMTAGVAWAWEMGFRWARWERDRKYEKSP